MKAAWYERTGPARDVLRVGEIDEPRPGSGEVLVRVRAHGVNPTDCKRRAGRRGPLPYPRIIPGYDAAGEIVAVGEGVRERQVGERVWLFECAHRKWDGAAAEFVRVPESRALPLPDHVSFGEGACLGVPAITACHALRLAAPRPGEWVLITGAAGAVGNYAVQLARFMGARVIGVVRGSKEREEDALRAGAEAVINTDRENLATRVLEIAGRAGVRGMVDVDLGAHLEIAWRLVALNGTIAYYGTASDPRAAADWYKYMYRNIRIWGVAIFEVPEEAKLRARNTVQQALEAGALRHRIDSRFPLEEIAAAHERQESGHPRGKIILEID